MLLSYFSRFSNEYNLLGDLDEEYAELAKMKGKRFARNWYRRNFLRTVPMLVKESLLWSLSMFENYVKIALRNLYKNKSISFINIFGLAIGMTCAILIFMWVQGQLSYNQFQEKKENIYRMETDTWVVLAPIMAEIPKGFPEVEEVVRFYFWWEPTIKYEEKTFTVTDVALCDSNVFRMFDFDFILGDPETALTAPNSIILTESISKKLFGNENPMGQKVIISSDDEYMVSAVVRDVEKLHMKINAFISVMDVVRDDPESDFLTSRSHNFDVYVLTKDGINVQSLVEKINIRGAEEFEYPDKNFLLRPFDDIYFNNDLAHENNTQHGNMDMIVVFSIIAILILLIACINFVNLTVAKTSIREKEIAIRKVVGAKQSSLQKQFFGETFFIVFLSFLLAMFSVYLLLPQFNDLTSERISFELIDLHFVFVLLGVIFFAAFVSGIYPSFYLSVLKPVLILKGKSENGVKGNSLSKVLIAFQFAIAIFLIITTLTVVDQLNFMQTADLGIDDDQMLTTTLRGENFSGSAENRIARKKLFKERIMQHPAISGVTYVTQLPGKITNTWNWYVENEAERTPLNVINSNPDFVDVMGLKLLEGRTHSFDIKSDYAHDPEARKFVVNETAVKALGLENPVDRIINGGGIQIIGVVADFHFNSLHTKIGPLGICWNKWPGRACIKISGKDINSAMAHIEKVYREFCPGVGFEYSFLDESFAKEYETEQRLESLLSYFVGVAITLSCLGLFALTAFMAERRIKEIGIRKVLGSSNSGIILLLAQSFLRWIVLANVIAWPVAYFVLDNWLQDYAYRIGISLVTFTGGTLLSLAIAMITISYQALKAASLNPAVSLKME